MFCTSIYTQYKPQMNTFKVSYTINLKSSSLTRVRYACMSIYRYDIKWFGWFFLPWLAWQGGSFLPKMIIKNK